MIYITMTYEGRQTLMKIIRESYCLYKGVDYDLEYWVNYIEDQWADRLESESLSVKLSGLHDMELREVSFNPSHEDYYIKELAYDVFSD